jgi:hypothetical protein
MKPLAFEVTKGKKLEWQSIGWKAPKEADCRRQLYALNEGGKALVVKPQPAMPKFYLPGSKAVFSCEPFPDAVCIEVSPCRLLPPPCYQSRQEFESQLPGHYSFDPWRAAYWETHKQVLILEPAADGPLQDRLDKWLAAMRRAYAKEAAGWRSRIKRMSGASLKELGFDTEERRANELAALRVQLGIVESENPIDGVPCKGWLKLNLEDVKRGHEGIRDVWMHEDWAKKNGEDLGVMARERRVFCRWLETHTGTPANFHDLNTRKNREEIAPPSFGEKFENNPQFLEGCAKVRFRARFADNANTTVYLADCEVRAELTSPELDEVAKLKAVSQPVQASDLVNLRPSSNYRQLFWTDGWKKKQANLTKTQSSAFSALHKAQGMVLAREEWQQEIYGDNPPSDFRPDKIFSYKDGRQVWKRFIRVEGDRYRIVIGRE